MITLPITPDRFAAIEKYYSGELRVLNRNHSWVTIQIQVDSSAHILQLIAAGIHLGQKQSPTFVNIEPKVVIDAITWAFGVSEDQLLGLRRDKHIVYARHAYRWILKEKLAYTHTMVAAATNSDHTTSLHSYRTCEALMQTDEIYNRRMKNALEYINIKTKAA